MNESKDGKFLRVELPECRGKAASIELFSRSIASDFVSRFHCNVVAVNDERNCALVQLNNENEISVNAIRDWLFSKLVRKDCHGTRFSFLWTLSPPPSSQLLSQSGNSIVFKDIPSSITSRMKVGSANTRFFGLAVNNLDPMPCLREFERFEHISDFISKNMGSISSSRRPTASPWSRDNDVIRVFDDFNSGNSNTPSAKFVVGLMNALKHAMKDDLNMIGFGVRARLGDVLLTSNGGRSGQAPGCPLPLRDFNHFAKRYRWKCLTPGKVLSSLEGFQRPNRVDRMLKRSSHLLPLWGYSLKKNDIPFEFTDLTFVNSKTGRCVVRVELNPETHDGGIEACEKMKMKTKMKMKIASFSPVKGIRSEDVLCVLGEDFSGVLRDSSTDFIGNFAIPDSSSSSELGYRIAVERSPISPPTEQETRCINSIQIVPKNNGTLVVEGFGDELRRSLSLISLRKKSRSVLSVKRSLENDDDSVRFYCIVDLVSSFEVETSNNGEITLHPTEENAIEAVVSSSSLFSYPSYVWEGDKLVSVVSDKSAFDLEGAMATLPAFWHFVHCCCGLFSND